ncbi:MAG: 2-oxoacid:acceptor oxidoreductase family protein [Oscillospiraceae bacterium]|nr:2-oxoacid:acceptor oxidoreductase family protein [Oscillospiraceae bacterium]
MAKSFSVIIAGYGGQGALFTGKVIAYAGLIDGREVSWFPSYGPEMRGGTVNCGVQFDDEPIGSPVVTRPDVLIAMNEPSLTKFIDQVIPGGKVILDSTLIKAEAGRDDIEVFPVPASQLSNDEGLEGIANIIMLGKMLKETGFTTFQTIEEAVRKSVPERKIHLFEHNIRAIKLGMSL